MHKTINRIFKRLTSSAYITHNAWFKYVTAQSHILMYYANDIKVSTELLPTQQS